MNLYDVFGLKGLPRSLGLIGAGGKTTLMFALAKELVARGHTVVSTTTTKIRIPSSEQSSALIIYDEHNHKALERDLRILRHVTLGSDVEEATDKVLGINPESIEKLLEVADYVLFEADGAAGRSVKAPEIWEPVLPSTTSLIIPVVGLDCLGKRISRDVVFRTDQFCRITEKNYNEPITMELLENLFLHPQGALKGVDPHWPVIIYFNKLDSATIDAICKLAHVLLVQIPQIRAVVAGSLIPHFHGFRFTRASFGDYPAD